ncbi:MAG: hypothetical protein EOP00_21950 [Pedobacter sp.]|nr:MAG: hypothetical protein EOP00_21950 [Pedobacter sp.]
MNKLKKFFSFANFTFAGEIALRIPQRSVSGLTLVATGRKPHKNDIMKNIILAITILLSVSGKSQAKAETEDWIITKYLSYKYLSPEQKGNILKIENGYLIQQTSYNWYDKIALKEIAQIKISSFKVENRQGYSLTLYCKNAKKCLEEGKIEYGKFVPQGTNSNNTFTIYFDISFGEDDLPNRMEKAILHLIKLNGGNAKLHKETF